MQDNLLDLPPKPDVSSFLIVVLPTIAALCIGLTAPAIVQPLAGRLTDCGVLPRLQSGLFAANLGMSVIALFTAACAVAFRVRLTEGWRTPEPGYAIVQKLYLGAAATLGVSGLYVWSGGYKIRFGEGCDAGFENPWAFAFKLFLVVVSWVLLANVRLMLQRINATASTAKTT